MRASVVTRLVQGRDVTCLSEGEGVPLVLVHGSLCDYRYWQWQMRALGAHYQILAPSLRHYFPERWNGLGDDFTTHQHVQDLIHLIESLSEPVHLVGHSRGGNLCLRVALAVPERLRSLSLADPGGDFTDDVFQVAGIQVPASPHERNRFRAEALELIRCGETEEGLRLFVDTVSGEGVWQRSSGQFREMAADNAMTLIGQVADRPAPLTQQALAHLPVPTLLISGALSPEPFPCVVRALAHTLPDAQVAAIEGASHGMNVVRPAAFNRTLLEFVERH
ncbi:MAG: Non-heme chloroperoxidase CPO-A1 [Pseudomonas sp.]|nr:MAG: Non-heme chloroperoxidase CPO-A1 [Pseudomonas sp.]